MEIKETFLLALLACVIFTTCFIAIRSKGASAMAVISKALASFCFVTSDPCLVVKLQCLWLNVEYLLWRKCMYNLGSFTNKIF